MSLHTPRDAAAGVDTAVHIRLKARRKVVTSIVCAACDLVCTAIRCDVGKSGSRRAAEHRADGSCGDRGRCRCAST